MRAKLFHIDTVLLTNRCVTRRFREGDGVHFYELVQRNSQYLSDHFPRLLSEVDSPEGAESFARRRLAGWLLQEDYAFGVWSTEAQLWGFVYLFNIDWLTPKGEISYFIDRDHTGQGIMTEVVARIIRFAFVELQLEKLILHTLIDNYPSQRLARRVGFRREGDLRGEFRKPTGPLLDLMRFGLTREEYGE